MEESLHWNTLGWVSFPLYVPIIFRSFCNSSSAVISFWAFDLNMIITLLLLLPMFASCLRVRVDISWILNWSAIPDIITTFMFTIYWKNTIFDSILFSLQWPGLVTLISVFGYVTIQISPVSSLAPLQTRHSVRWEWGSEEQRSEGGQTCKLLPRVESDCRHSERERERSVCCIQWSDQTSARGSCPLTPQQGDFKCYHLSLYLHFAGP